MNRIFHCGLLLNASWVVQFVVVLLVGVSIASWAAIFRKIIALKRCHSTTSLTASSGRAPANDLFAAANKKCKHSGSMERILPAACAKFTAQAQHQGFGHRWAALGAPCGQATSAELDAIEI
jgi:biopolymer transport protein TolQ